MSRYRSRSRFVPIVLIVIIIIVAVAAIISLARAVFFSRSSNSGTVEVVTLEDHLLNSALGRSVRMTIRGPIVADENFHSYRITVSPTARNLTTYNGYLEQQVDVVALSNNTRAYEEFTHALNLAKMVAGEPFEGEQNDIRGICASGKVYEFEVRNNESTLGHFWTSTCKGSPGSLDASASQLSKLFIAQIPDAQEVIKNVKLQ